MTNNQSLKILINYGLFFIFLLVLIAPGYVFFQNRDGLGFLLGADFKTAARLGNKRAQDYLKSKGISW